MSLKRKWKLFAIGHFFCNELSAEEAEALYDTLIKCESSLGMVEAISKVHIWAEFESMEPLYLIEMMENLAEHAQEVDEDGVQTVPVTRIVRVALAINGAIYSLPSPARHHDVIHSLPIQTLGLEFEQGFVDSTGRFLNRKDAMFVAQEANQLIRDSDPTHYQGPKLFSEDLW